MSAFIQGFRKEAGLLENAATTAKKVGIGTARVGQGAAKGLSEAGKGTVGDALKLKGLGNLSDAYKAHGVEGLKTKAGQQAWGHAIGKAAPSLAAAGGYAYAGKKVYDKTLGSQSDQSGYYYQ